jgi:uncharacterized membrane protein YphA (DoxX/SURF4 family)
VAAEAFLALRWALAVVFVIAGLPKLGNPKSFAEKIAEYGLVPAAVRPALARGLPLVEVAVGVCLAAGIWPTAMGWLACFLLAGFAFAVGWNVAHGRRFDCGCGAIHSSDISWTLAIQDLALAGVALAIAVGPAGALAIAPGGAGIPKNTPAGSSLLAIPLLVLLVLAAGRLLATRPPFWTPHLRRTNSAAAVNGSPALSVLQVDTRRSDRREELRT